jgi:hypothetical protein
MLGMKKKNMLFCALIGTAMSLLLSLILLLAVAWAVNSEFITQKDAVIPVYAAVFFSVLIAAHEAAKGKGKSYIICGLLSALGYTLTAVLAYALGGEKQDFLTWIMRIIVVTAMAGLLGGVWAIQKKSGKKSKHPKKYNR